MLNRKLVFSISLFLLLSLLVCWYDANVSAKPCHRSSGKHVKKAKDILDILVDVLLKEETDTILSDARSEELYFRFEDVPLPVNQLESMEAFDKCINRCKKHQQRSAQFDYAYCELNCLAIKPRTETELQEFATQFINMRNYFASAVNETVRECIFNFKTKYTDLMGKYLKAKGFRDALIQLATDWNKLPVEERTFFYKTSYIRKNIEGYPIDTRQDIIKTIDYVDNIDKMTEMERYQLTKLSNPTYADQVKEIENHLTKIYKVDAYLSNKNREIRFLILPFSNIRVIEELPKMLETFKQTVQSVTQPDMEKIVKEYNCQATD